MGLAAKSMGESLSFIRKYPVALAFMFVVYVAYTIVSVMWLYAGPGMTALLYGFGFFLVAAAVVVADILISLINAGAFPVIVLSSLKKRKSVAKDAVGRSLKKIAGLFGVTAITLIAVGLPILPAFSIMIYSSVINGLSGPIAPSMTPDFAFSVPSIVLAVTGLFVSFYLTARLWLSFPVMMLEDKGIVDSIRASWKMSGGRVLSIWGTLIMLGVILGTLSIAADYASSAVGIDALGLILSLAVGTFSGALSGVLNTVYYLNLKKK